MSLAGISIRRPVFAWMLMAGLILFGVVSYFRLGVSELPDVDFPVVNIEADLSGATPEVMESDVADIIENSVMGVAGLKNITSTSRYGSANITLEFELDRNIDFAMQEVQSKVASANKLLPQDLDPPIVTKTNPEDSPILWLSLSCNCTQRELMGFARDKVMTQFQLVPGVGDVFLGGYLEPNIRVWIDAQKLANYDLAITDVLDAVKTEHVEVPAGTFQKGEKEYTLKVLGEAMTPEEFGRIVIPRRGGLPNYSPVHIKDIGRVEAGLEDVRRSSRVMGQEGVGIGIRKQRGTNAVEIAKAVKLKLADIKKSLPAGYDMAINFDSTRFIEESMHELQFELIVASLLTGIVCWLFLGSWSSTVNVLFAIPTSLIGALTVLYFLGFTLNTFTFLGLILAVGIVVDDAIMVLENIVRHREMGKSKENAARDGTDQISFAALATTLAIVAIFLPVAFMKGVIGKFFLQFGVTISVTVLLSLVEALTLTPMRCAAFLQISHEHGTTKVDKLMEFLTVKYRWWLNKALDHKGLVAGAAVLIFVSSLFLLGGMKKEFVPAQDQSMFLVRFQTPVGSSMEYTKELIGKAEEVTTHVPEIKRYFAAIGGFGNVNQVNTGMMFITLKNRDERKRSQIDVMNDLRSQLKSIKDLRSIMQDLSTRGFSAQRGFPIEFSLRGPAWESLVTKSREVMEELKKDKRFVDVDSNYDEGMPEIQIIPNREKARAKGVSIEDIGKAIGYLVGGDKVARFTEGGKRIDVRVRLTEDFRDSPETMLDLAVRNNRGELIRLREVADMKITKSLISITREQRERAISIYANVGPGASQADLVAKVESIGAALPPGYRLVMGGNSKAFSESFGSLIFALYLGIAVAYMILASQFNSFVHPVTVLLALPFSLTGAWIALRIGDKSLNIYSMIGFILLMGIVKKNSIMLVDFSNQLRAEGKNPRTALLEACPIRLRPIIMTSLAIIVAAIPSVVGIGPGSETRVPMSLSVIGGVTLSTLFTLFVVPCAYLIFSRFERHKVPASVKDVIVVRPEAEAAGETAVL